MVRQLVLVIKMQEEPIPAVRKDAIAALINLATDDVFAGIMAAEGSLHARVAARVDDAVAAGIVPEVVRRILDSEEEHVDPCCMLLTNLTRSAAVLVGCVWFMCVDTRRLPSC